MGIDVDIVNSIIYVHLSDLLTSVKNKDDVLFLLFLLFSPLGVFRRSSAHQEGACRRCALKEAQYSLQINTECLSVQMNTVLHIQSPPNLWQRNFILIWNIFNFML